MFNVPNNNIEPNSLYYNTFIQTQNKMQNQVNLIETNINSNTNILSLINLPVLVPYHINHPLIACKTPGRIIPGYHWRCNVCKTKYTFDVPSFYCTYCDFDLCQKCFLCLYAYQIVVYNYNQGFIQEKPNLSSLFYNNKIHYHSMVEILREKSYYISDFRCNICFKDIKEKENFYFCSLCNYCICVKCHKDKIKQQPNNINNINNINIINNVDNDPNPYLSVDQLPINKLNSQHSGDDTLYLSGQHLS